MKNKISEIEAIFWKSNSIKEFASNLPSLKESSVKVYWYTLSKKHGRKIEEKRGRKPSKPNYQELYENMVGRVKEEMEKAKSAKKSVSAFKYILGE